MASRTHRCASTVIAGRLAWLVACAFLSACALAPPPSSEDLRPQVLPTTPLPPQWTAGHPGAGNVESNWLATFGDPHLEELVAEAVFFNSDLRLAAARVEQAGALVKVAGGSLWPSVTFVGIAGGEIGRAHV